LSAKCVGGGLDIDARPGPHFARLTPLPPSTLGRVSTLSAAPGQTRASALLVASCGWQSDDNAAIAARKASAASRLIRHVRHVAHMPLRVCHCLLSLRSCWNAWSFKTAGSTFGGISNFDPVAIYLSRA